ncbi:MFS transporter [Streptacidiphilus jiangxiensis]|uniref:Transmembrane secretion effector n=1 Tax=Streptacidiphilus jiangxiensis TaxID=235985 RepID=A0A1H7TPG7_STRJI|nr:MFS transporter [Streptacidiphilus jiangxiensis]SEL86354.1 Transmembrane secretion effector [Streptacidiphilus jiangxiensis]
MTTAVRQQVGQEAPPKGAARVAAFWRYWSASTVSGVGDAVTAVALPLLAVLALHASAFEVSLITAASYVAWLLIGLPAGVLVHRLPLRGTQVAMDLVRAAAVASVPVAAALGELSLTQLIVVALVVGLASVVFDVGNSTFLPGIVSKEELTTRNSLTSGARAATQLGGPSLGGVLVQLLGAATSMVVDSVSYVLSAALMGSLPQVAHPAQEGPRRGMGEMIREGWRYVTRHPVIGPCAAYATAVNFVCGGLMALTPVFLVRSVGAPPALVGLLIATEGVGSLVGAALTPRIVARLGSGRALRRAAVATPCFALLMPLAGSSLTLGLFALGNAGFAAAVVVTSIVTRTFRQAATPPELLPRVMATVRFVSWGAIPFGALTAGGAAALWGTRSALVLMAALAAISPLILLASPIRRMRELA